MELLRPRLGLGRFGFIIIIFEVRRRCDWRILEICRRGWGGVLRGGCWALSGSQMEKGSPHGGAHVLHNGSGSPTVAGVAVSA
jgi:hypothetical protein